MNNLTYIDPTWYMLKRDENATNYLKSLSPSKPKVIQYSQEDEGKVDTTEMCVVFANAIAVSTIFQKTWTRQELEDCVTLGIKQYNLKLDGGNPDLMWAKAVAIYNNKWPKKAAFFGAIIMDEWFELALDKWLLATLSMGWYKTGNALFFAQMWNGEITGGKNMRVKDSHLICIGRWKDGGYMFYNSDKKKSKAYCSKEVFKDLMKQSVFYQSARIRLPLDKITDLTPEQYRAYTLVVAAVDNMEKYWDADDRRVGDIVKDYFKKKYNV